MAEMEEVLGYAVACSIVFIITVLIVTVLILKNKNDVSFIIWHYISWVNFIKWTALINSDVPESFLSFFNVLIRILKPKPINTFAKYSTVPTRFSELGITHPYFLNNAELSLIIITLILFVYTVFFLIKKEKVEKIRKIVCHNSIIRGILLLFLEFSVFAFLQLSRFEITTLYGIINSLLGVVTLTVLAICMTMFSFLAIRKQEASDESKTSTDTLTQEFKKTKIVQRLYYLIYMLERLVCSLVFVFLQRLPHIQCLVVELAVGCKCNTYLVLYVLVIQPFTENSLNYLTTTLDAATLIIVALITSFMISMDDLSRETIFYFIVFFVFFGLVVTFFWFIKELRRVDVDVNCDSAQTASKLGNDRQGIQVTAFTDSIWMKKDKSRKKKPSIKIEDLDKTKDHPHETENSPHKLQPEILNEKKNKTKAFKQNVDIPKLQLSQDNEIKDWASISISKKDEIAKNRDNYGNIMVKEFEYIKKSKLKDSALSTLNKEEERSVYSSYSAQKKNKDLSPHKLSIQEIFNSKVVKKARHASDKPSLLSIYENKVRRSGNVDSHEARNAYVGDSKVENRITREPVEDFSAKGSVNDAFETQVKEFQDTNNSNLGYGQVSSNYLEARLPFYGPLAKKYNVSQVLK